MKRFVLNIGDIVVSSEPAIMETVLGPCVAVCLWDRKKGIGGMNHFMLPRMMEGMMNPGYAGRESTERLIDALLGIGATLEDMRAKLFGGASLRGLSRRPLGMENVAVAKEALARFRIPIIGELTGYDCSTRVLFHSDTGRTLIKRVRWDGIERIAKVLKGMRGEGEDKGPCSG